MKIKTRIRSLGERVILWFLREFLFAYSAVVAREFGKLEQFQAEVKLVAADHWQHLNRLDARLRKLEKEA